ncbi:MAG: hypothetical protein KDB82_07090 [Planctomycetes bacterium]|nr:hypothetical protein [Planctomycetota bacterium]
MRNAILTVLAGVALLACISYTGADPVHAEGPDGDALAEKAGKLRNALLSGTTDELFNQLPSYLRGRGELFKEGIPELIENELADFPEEKRDEFRGKLQESIVERAQSRDPAGKLGVKTFDDILKLKAADMYAMDVGQLRLQADADLKANREAKWHEVSRDVYEAEDDIAWTQGPKHGTRTYGAISFMNHFKDAMQVTCVAEGDSWQVIDYALRVGKRDLRLDRSELVKDPMVPLIDEEVLSYKRAEGEQLLGAARDYSRVENAKNGTPPKKLSDGVELDTFEGMYFRVRDKVYKKPDANRGAIVAEPVDEKSNLGWGVIYFDYESGKSDFKWFDTKDALDEALKAFQTAK